MRKGRKESFFTAMQQNAVDASRTDANKGDAMRHSLILSLAGLAALSACNGSSSETINETIGDPMAEELKNAPKAELPPMLKESHSYRCKDNSLIYVDFMTDEKTANFKTEKQGPVTVLKAAEPGQPFTSADGTKTLEGSGETVTYNGQSCKG